MILSDETADRARAGDVDAVALIYRALAPKVQGYLTVRGAEDPEGLTQDVFLAVLPQLGEVSGGEAGLRRFVFSVAHRRYVDEVRRRSRRPRLVGYEPDADPRVEEPAEHAAVAMVSLGEVSRHLRRLTQDQAAVVSLRLLADFSIQETADVLGRSPGSVKQLQRRALEALRMMLDEEGVRR